VTVGIAPNQQASIPNRFSIEQNYPNPFNPETVVSYELFASAAVQVEVFNELDQSVAFLYDGNKAAGRHQFTWNGRNQIGAVVSYRKYFLIANKSRVRSSGGNGGFSPSPADILCSFCVLRSLCSPLYFSLHFYNSILFSLVP